MVCLWLGVPQAARAQVSQLTYPLDATADVPAQPVFQWTSVPGAVAYYLYVGTSVGAKDVIDSNQTTLTAYTTVKLLAPGQHFYVRLWTKSDVWRYVDTQFSTAAVANLTAPAAGAVNVDLNPVFTWSAAPGATAYYLYVGTTVGGRDVVDSHQLASTVTAFTPSRLPAGVTLYARIWTATGTLWRSVDSTFTTMSLATIGSPANGQVNVNPQQAITWLAVGGADAYYLYLGTALGLKDIVDSGQLSATVYQPRAILPVGQTIYARLWTRAAGIWRSTDSTFTTIAALAVLTSPAPNATNVDPVTTFSWTAITNAQKYYLYVGTTQGAKDLVDSGELAQTSFTPSPAWYRNGAHAEWNLPASEIPVTGYAFTVDGNRVDFGLPASTSCPDDPTNGCYSVPVPPTSQGSHPVQVIAINSQGEAASSTATFAVPGQVVFVRVWTKADNVWRYIDTSISIARLTPAFTYPAYGMAGVNPLKSVSWTAVPGATAYSLSIGLNPGGTDFVDVTGLTTTSYRAPELFSMPSGVRLFARVGASVNGTWRFSETIFTVSPVATLTHPYDLATDLIPGSWFSWTVIPEAQAYYLYVGTTPGGVDLVDSHELQDTYYIPTHTLPLNVTLYARLWTKVGGVWRSVDSTFVAIVPPPG